MSFFLGGIRRLRTSTIGEGVNIYLTLFYLSFGARGKWWRRRMRSFSTSESRSARNGIVIVCVCGWERGKELGVAAGSWLVSSASPFKVASAFLPAAARDTGRCRATLARCCGRSFDFSTRRFHSHPALPSRTAAAATTPNQTGQRA